MTINAHGDNSSKDASERRSSQRKPLIVAVRFAGATSGTAETREIGFGGLYLATPADLPVNSHLKLEFKLGESTVNVDAIVVYQDQGAGIGVRFLDVSESVQEILRRELPAIETANVGVKRK